MADDAPVILFDPAPRTAAASLEAVLSEPRVIFALAGVTEENRGLLSRQRMQSARAETVGRWRSPPGRSDLHGLQRSSAPDP